MYSLIIYNVLFEILWYVHYVHAYICMLYTIHVHVFPFPSFFSLLSPFFLSVFLFLFLFLFPFHLIPPLSSLPPSLSSSLSPSPLSLPPFPSLPPSLPPQVVNLGLCGVFTILEEIWQTDPELCHRVLAEFLNILQGQAPGGLKNEPIQSTGNKVEEEK